MTVSGFAPHLSVLAVLRNSRTVIGFFWMLYWVKRPDWPVTTCWIGAGITKSSMSSYVRLGFQSFGGTTYEKDTRILSEGWIDNLTTKVNEHGRIFKQGPLPCPLCDLPVTPYMQCICWSLWTPLLLDERSWSWWQDSGSSESLKPFCFLDWMKSRTKLSNEDINPFHSSSSFSTF